MKKYWNDFWKSKELIYKLYEPFVSILKNLYFTNIKVDYIKKFISNSHILEIGCGNGKLLERLPNNNKMTGLDISRFAIKKARKNLKNNKISLILDDIFNKRFKSNTFDLVFSDSIIEHYSDRLEEFIREEYRITKRGGYIITILGNNGLIRRIMFKFVYQWDKDKTMSTEDYKKTFNKIIQKISKNYKIETVPKSFGILMAVVIKK